MAPNVHVDALHALLMEFVVVAKAHQVLQQAALLDLRAAVADAYAAPVGLAGDQAIAFQQLVVRVSVTGCSSKFAVNKCGAGW